MVMDSSSKSTYSADEWRRLLQAEKQRNKRGTKYGNKRVKINGIAYDSTGEANYEKTVLDPLRAKGELTYRRQVTFPLVVNGVKICNYRADWVVTWKNGKQEVWDFKARDERIKKDDGFLITSEFKLKRKLMLACHGLEIILKSAVK